MDSQEVKYFSAVTYDFGTFNFAVTPNGSIYCKEFGKAIPAASTIELKPNFILRNKNGRSFYSLDEYARDNKIKKSLISNWIINDDVFEYLVKNNKIMYSTQIAILYGLDPQYAFDAFYQKRAFKHTRNNALKRARVLAPQKTGKFN